MIDRSEFTGAESKINNDYDSFEDIISKMSEENQALGQEIKKLVSNVHEKISKKNIRENYSLLKYIRNDIGGDGYSTIGKKLSDIGFSDKLKELISQAIKDNSTLDNKEKSNLKAWFEQQFQTDDFKNAIDSKINVDLDIDTQIKNTPELNSTVFDIYEKILSKSTVVNQLNAKIFSLVRNFNNYHFENVAKLALNNFRRTNVDKIQQIKFQNDQLWKIKQTIDKTNETLQDRYIAKSKIKFVNKYNKFLYNTFKGGIRKLSGKSVEDMVNNVLTYKLSQKVLYHFTHAKKSIMKTIRRLKNKRWWKLQTAYLMRDVKKILFSIGKAAIMGLPGLLWWGVKFHFKMLSGLFSISFNLVKGGIKLVKNILKLSVKIVKSSLKNGLNFLNRIRLFLFSPIGAFISGIIVGFVWDKIKTFYHYMIEKLEEWKQKIKDYFKDLHKTLYKESPLYRKVSDKIEDLWIKVTKNYDSSKQLCESYRSDLKDILNETDEKKRKEKIAALKEKAIKDFKIDEIRNSINGFTIETLEAAAENLRNLQDIITRGEIENVAQKIMDFTELYGKNSIVANTADSALTTTISTVSVIAGGIAFGPIGALVGGAVGGLIGKIVGKCAAAWIKKIPEKEKQINASKLASDISQRYNKKYATSFNDLFKQEYKYDWETLRELRELREKKHNLELKYYNNSSDDKKRQEYQEVVERIRQIQQENGRGYKQQYQDNNAEQLDERIQQLMDSGNKMILNTAEQIDQYLFTDTVRLNALNDEEIYGNEDAKNIMEIKKQFIGKLLDKLKEEYVKGKINREQFVQQLKKGQEYFNNRKIRIEAVDLLGPHFNYERTYKEWLQGSNLSAFSKIQDKSQETGETIFPQELQEQALKDIWEGFKIDIPDVNKTAQEIWDEIINDNDEVFKSHREKIRYNEPQILPYIKWCLQNGENKKTIKNKIKEIFKNDKDLEELKIDYSHDGFGDKIIQALGTQAYKILSTINGKNQKEKMEYLKQFLYKNGIDSNNLSIDEGKVSQLSTIRQQNENLEGYINTLSGFLENPGQYFIIQNTQDERDKTENNTGS